MSNVFGEAKRLLVLVVEDEPAIALLQMKTLEDSGFIVEQAATGDAALQRLARGGVDVALLDHQLPGMSGEEVLAKIRATAPSTPVIMVTGHGSEVLAARSIMLGAKDYVVKDSRLEYLRILPDVIQRVHRQSVAEETARALAAKLAESEGKYRILAENMLDVIWMMSLDGRFTYVSPSVMQLRGYTPEEVMSRPALEALTPESARIVEESIKKTLELEARGEVISDNYYELEQPRKDGSAVWTECVVTRLRDAEGKLTGFLGVSRDITTRRKMESELRAAKERAEKYAGLQDRFVSLVVHDLKSPLASMTGLLMILDSEWDNISHERRKEIIDRTVESGLKMSVVIEEIMNISRLRTGQIKPTPIFLDAHSVAEMAMENMSQWAVEKSVTLVNEVEPGSRLYADLPLFTEALKNLVSNAVKFSRKGGTVKISYSSDQDMANLSVTDFGVGMDQDVIPRLFNDEARITATGTAGEIGTGWGLKYCMDIMKAHNGSIRVDSVKGKGTTVALRVPAVKPVALVVDDEPLFLQILRNLAESLGAEVMEASDGEEALKVMEKAVPHIIISDIHMPKLNGMALLERVRKNKDTALTPFIILTSDKRMDLRERAFRLGANDFLNKPISVEDFTPRVKRFIF